MAEASTADLFPLGEDDTPYRKLTSDYVSVDTFKGQEVLTVDLEGFAYFQKQPLPISTICCAPAICNSLQRFFRIPKQPTMTASSPTTF
ncbi:Fumarate hydratase class I, aerobic [Brucella ceti TE28753-12]|nr:Fumarate hydratase class I, aerobic [Brucella ceti TE28753-12]